jgi:hypothetical protein
MRMTAPGHSRRTDGPHGSGGGEQRRQRNRREIDLVVRALEILERREAVGAAFLTAHFFVFRHSIPAGRMLR